jgi:hypothetical protein
MTDMDVPQFMSEAGPKSGEAAVEPLRSPARAFSARRGMWGLVIAAATFNGLAYPLIRIVVATVVFNSRGLGGGVAMWLLVPLASAVLAGEMVALACWLVWSGGSFLRRLAVHWAIGAALLMTLICGILLAAAGTQTSGQTFRSLGEALVIACCLPTISLAAQIPLWPFRTHLGWRIVPPGEVASGAKDQPLSILDILSGTAVVAVSLGLIRFLPRVPSSFMWMQMATMSVAIAVTSIVVMLPAIILILRVRAVAVGAGVYFGGVALSVYGLIVVVGLLSNRFPPGQMFFSTVWSSLWFAATVAAPLFVWRWCGYRLVWARDRR